jgi:hypothetical protein
VLKGTLFEQTKVKIATKGRKLISFSSFLAQKVNNALMDGNVIFSQQGVTEELQLILCDNIIFSLSFT